jgi:hypothetical protein
MFNIYEKEGDAVSEAEKVRLLFKKVTHEKLNDSISALQAQQTLGNVLTYSQCANHLSARVSELPEYIAKNRNVSGVTQKGRGGGSEGIYAADGSIKTGHISNWADLSKEDKELVKKERLKKKSGTAGGNGNNKSIKNQMKQVKNQNKVYKRQIQALKKKGVTFEDEEKEDEDSTNSDDDAGDQFGGQNAKKKKKKSRASS